jgi:hypothetical protein
MLKIEAMRMYYGCQNVPEQEFEREREVVRNEIRAQSSAEGQVVQYVEAAFYPKGHAYERMVGGNDEQIASASLQEVCDFMKKYYTPDRAVLLVAGGVNVDDTIAMIEKWFAKIPKRDPAPRVDVKPFTVAHDKKVIEADVERPMVFIGWPLPGSRWSRAPTARRMRSRSPIRASTPRCTARVAPSASAPMPGSRPSAFPSSSSTSTRTPISSGSTLASARAPARFSPSPRESRPALRLRRRTPRARARVGSRAR